MRSRVCRREGCRSRIRFPSPAVLDAGEDAATLALGELFAEVTEKRADAGVVGSLACLAVRFDGEAGRLYAGIAGSVGKGGGTKRGRVSDG